MKINELPKKILLLLLLIIVSIILFPALYWWDEIKLAPDIFVTEWYKTIITTVIFGAIYKFIVEPGLKSYFSTQNKTRNKEIVLNSLNIIRNSYLDKHLDITQSTFWNIKQLIEKDALYAQIIKQITTIETKIKGLKSENHSEEVISEMKNQIDFELKELLKIIKIS